MARRASAQVDGGRELPRLIIVIDEAAGLLAEFPEMRDVLALVGSRGRSLAMHLVVGTQAVHRVDLKLDALFPTRIALRVPDRAASLAVIGEHGAESLNQPGEALIKRPGEGPVSFRTAWLGDRVNEVVAAVTAAAARLTSDRGSVAGLGGAYADCLDPTGPPLVLPPDPKLGQ